MSRLNLVNLVIAVLIAALLLSTSTVVSADESNPPDKPIQSGTVTKTNGFYSIFVEDAGYNIGSYTVSTGANHPVTVWAGSPQNVLYGGEYSSPGTSFNTIRSYTTQTDYVTSPNRTSDFAVINLDDYSTGTVPLGDTGIRTTWVLPGPPATPDRLNIAQDIEIVGTTLANSSIKVKVQVTNPNPSAVDLGVRYLWDFQIGDDDGPTFTPLYLDGSGGSAITTEAEFQPPEFVAYHIQDNDLNPNPPTFGVNGSATPPPGLDPIFSTPGILQFVCWRDAVNTAFNYTVDPNKDITTTASTCRGYAGGDTAVTYTFGPDATSALGVGSNETLTLTAYLLAATPQDSDGDGLFDVWEMEDTDLNGDGVIDIGPSLGADPNRKDIYVEVDWMEDENHSHKPDPAAIQKIVEAFDAQNINLHVDAGPDSIDYVTGNAWGQHSKGNAIAHDNFLDFAKWELLREANCGHSDRVYRHALFAHQAIGNLLGYGDIQYLFVALGTKKDGVGTLNEQAGVFMHELGHTLNLWHGGSKEQAANEFHFKPNYLSVMNYNFTTSGLIINGTDGHFDYSSFDLPDLNEAELIEANGLDDERVSNYSTKYNISFPWFCITADPEFSLTKPIYVISRYSPIDWNCNGEIDAGAVHDDINGMGGSDQTLIGWDDWSNLDFTMGNIGKLGILFPVPITDIHDDLTEEIDLQIQRISDPRAQLSSIVTVPSIQPGGAVTYTITMLNIDLQDVEGVVITDTLPAGFAYIAGSTSGATTSDPVIDGQHLSWSPFVVPANGGVLTLTFQATASQVPGTYFNNVGGTSSNGYVVPTGDTTPVEVISSPVGITEIYIGETYVMYYDDSGNGDYLIAQHTTLSQEGTLQSLSFYVTEAVGKLRLGLYNDNNGSPGALAAKTDEFTPVAGWNTRSVQTPVLLPPGSYWLAYLPESDDLHAPYGWPGLGQNIGRFYSYPYGEMPAAFSSSAWLGNFQFSLYATFTVSVPPGTLYVGEVNVLHAPMDGAGSLLIAQKAELPQAAVIQSLSFYAAEAAGRLRLGIYNNGYDGPQTLLAQTDEFTPAAGWNTVNVQTPIPLPAGTYWLAFLPESNDLEFRYEWIPGLYTGRVYGYPFGELPAQVSAQGIGVEYRFSLYATLIADNSFAFPSVPVLDDFNRADGPVGGNWSGSLSNFQIQNNQLAPLYPGSYIGLAWNESFGADQEAYLTIASLSSAEWIGLSLKAHAGGSGIDVLYSEESHVLDVYYGNDGVYTTVGIIPYDLDDGDQLGARVDANGIVTVYVNGMLIATLNASGYQYNAQGGQIGLYVEQYAPNATRIDDFGGGNVPGGEMRMTAVSDSMEGDSVSGSAEFVVVGSQLNLQTGSAFLSGTSAATGPKAFVILPPAGTTDLYASVKPRSHELWAQGTIQATFDLANQRIQVLKYDSQKGWVQIGKDIPVKFADGDRFRVDAASDGALRIYRNGKLLAKRSVSP